MKVGFNNLVQCYMFCKEHEKLKILNKKYKHIIELNAQNEEEEE